MTPRERLRAKLAAMTEEERAEWITRVLLFAWCTCDDHTPCPVHQEPPEPDETVAEYIAAAQRERDK